MTDNSKNSAGFNAFKIGLLIIIIMSFVIPIIYFNITVVPMAMLDDLNKTSLYTEEVDKFYKWDILLQLLAVVALLSLLYFTVTIKLSKVYHKLIGSYPEFIKQISLSEVIIKCFIILATLIALSLVIRDLYCDCSNWWFILSARLTSLHEPLNSRYIMIGIAGAVALLLTAWRTYIADRQLVIADEQNKSRNKQTASQIEQTASQIKQTESYVKQTKIAAARQFNERFDNAANALSKELNNSSFPAHLGAISALRALAIDSYEDTQRCLDIIFSCNQWMEEYIDEFIEKGGQDPYSSYLLKEDNRIANKKDGGKITLLHEKRSQEVLAAVSHILTRVSTNNPKQLKELKFHNKMLCGISLNNLILDGIDFNSAYLVAANLDKISLKKANLNRANLQGAFLSATNLDEASLKDANLQGSHLISSNLKRVSLDNANFREVFVFDVNLFAASLHMANLQGTALAKADLQGSSLVYAKLQGVSLFEANLQGAVLINTQLQGAYLDNVNLSHTLLLDCNLYGVTLKDIKNESNIFNDIVKVGYVQDKEERKKYLYDVCQHLKPQGAKRFTEQMEAAWWAMENNQEPDGLKEIRDSSIVTQNNQGMYDIREENLDNLQKKWQAMVNINDNEGRFLHNIENSISLLSVFPRGNLYQEADKNANLFNKLEALAKKLIESNKNTKE